MASLIKPTTYYKILTSFEFSKLVNESIFIGNSRDLKSGYIHMSNSRTQVDRILQKHYSEQDNIFVLSLKFKRRVNIFTERASDGDLYPHLFGVIKYEDISFIEAI